MERPAAVAIGQRWSSGSRGTREIVVRRRVSGAWAYCVEGHIDADDGWRHTGDCCWFTDEWFRTAPFLGYVEGHSHTPVPGESEVSLEGPFGNGIVWQGSLDGETWVEALQGKACTYPFCRAFNRGRLYFQGKMENGNLVALPVPAVPGEPTGTRGADGPVDWIAAKDTEIANLKSALACKDHLARELRLTIASLQGRLTQYASEAHSQGRKKAAPEPWRPTVGDWDLLPDV